MFLQPLQKNGAGVTGAPRCPLVLLNESTLHTHDDSVCSVFWHLLPERLEWHRATHLNCKWAVCFPQSTNRIWEHSPNYEQTGLYLWQSVRPTRAELKAWSHKRRVTEEVWWYVDEQIDVFTVYKDGWTLSAILTEKMSLSKNTMS